MQAIIDRLISDFQNGRISRRQVVTRLVGLIVSLTGVGHAARTTEGAPTPFRAVGLNHIALKVTDVARSRVFYTDLLGMSVSTEDRSSSFLTCGDQFVALFRSDEPGLDHYCYAVEDYDVNTAEKTLRAHGLESYTESNRIYFDDPDGLEVQLSSVRHRA